MLAYFPPPPFFADEADDAPPFGVSAANPRVDRPPRVVGGGVRRVACVNIRRPIVIVAADDAEANDVVVVAVFTTAAPRPAVVDASHRAIARAILRPIVARVMTRRGVTRRVDSLDARR